MTGCRGLVIAGTQSGVGKTTVTLGLLSALRRRNLTVQPFKVGPDFIDPGHHGRAAGRCSSHSLDGWMLSREANLTLFRRHAAQAQVAVVEGVMGLFDGYDGASEAGSTAQMAKWLGLPTLLVVDARAMARSAAALVKGFAAFDLELALAGVVFNRVGGAGHWQYLQEAMEQVPDVKCLGGLPREPDITIPERHLGLVTSEDHPLGEEYLERLAAWVEGHLDLDRLLASLPLLPQPPAAPPASPQPPRVRPGGGPGPGLLLLLPGKLGMAGAFRGRTGAVFPADGPATARRPPWPLPGGGYPELFAGQLAANEGIKRQLAEAAAGGLPIYAECGGLMYPVPGNPGSEGQSHPMAGLLPFRVRMLPRLKTLGYREVTLRTAGLLGPAGTKARGHEFHYSEIEAETGDVRRVYQIAARQGSAPPPEGYSLGNVLASYVHLHFSSNPEVARHLVQSCLEYRASRRN